MATPCSSGIPVLARQRLREHYRAALLENIVPWWEKHGPDRQFHGIFSCLERDVPVHSKN